MPPAPGLVSQPPALGMVTLKVPDNVLEHRFAGKVDGRALLDNEAPHDRCFPLWKPMAPTLEELDLLVSMAPRDLAVTARSSSWTHSLHMLTLRSSVACRICVGLIFWSSTRHERCTDGRMSFSALCSSFARVEDPSLPMALPSINIAMGAPMDAWVSWIV